MLSCYSCVQLFVNLRTVAHQAPLSMGFSGQEYWSGVPLDYNKLQKILKEMRKPDHLTCILRNLYAGEEATVRTGHGTDWFQIGKECVKAVYYHPAYLTYMQSTS